MRTHAGSLPVLLSVCLALLTGCPSDERTPVRKPSGEPWTRVPVPEPGPTSTSSTSERPVPDQPDAPTAVAEPPSPFFPTSVLAWQAATSPSDLKLVVEKERALKADQLTEISYPHPFVAAPGPLANLARRVVAKDSSARTFDMRDALVLPVPSTLEVAVPSLNRAHLTFSYCILDSAFRGKQTEELAFTVVYQGKNDAHQLFYEHLETGGKNRCKTWTDVFLPLPNMEVPDGRIVFQQISSKGPENAAEGLVISNLAVRVEVAGPEDDQLEKLSSSLGPVAGPNVVIVFIDSARGDCVGPANTSFPSVTPALDALAAKGVPFVNAFSVSNQTRGSIVGFLQSQHPTVGKYHGRWWNLKQKVIDEYYAAGPPLVTLLARRAGYATASIGRNHFQYGTTRMGLDPGFEMVFDNRRATGDTERIIDRAIGFISQKKGEKFFLLVNISPPHQPYEAPEQYETWTREKLKGQKHLVARKDYLSEIYFADQEVGRLLAEIEALGLTGKTVILVTADHGETMHSSHECNSELYKTICHNSHGLTLFDEELHIPLIWSAPFLADLSSRVRANHVSHLDVAPTLMELMGLPRHPRQTGRSLVPDLSGGELPDEEIYVETRMASAVRTDGWKYILHHRRDDARTQAWLSGPEGTKEELYDLDSDPFETKNLVGKKPLKAKELRAALKRLRTGFHDKVRRAEGTSWHPAQPAGGPDPYPECERGACPEPAEPSAPAPTSAKGFIYLALNADRSARSFSGEITTTGKVTSVETRSGSDCFSHSGPGKVGVHCTLEAESAMARLGLQDPPSALDFNVKMNGEPLSSRNLYLGRFGLAFLDSAELDEASYSLAYTRSPPNFIPGFDPGIFVWHSLRTTAPGSNAAPEDAAFEGKETIQDEAARKMLKNLGYWK